MWLHALTRVTSSYALLLLLRAFLLIAVFKHVHKLQTKAVRNTIAYRCSICLFDLGQIVYYVPSWRVITETFWEKSPTLLVTAATTQVYV